MSYQCLIKLRIFKPTRTQTAYTDGPSDFNVQKEVYFDPDPANFPNYWNLYPNFPEVDSEYVNKGTWTGAEYSRLVNRREA